MCCNCKFKVCKECQNRRIVEWFTKSENSDDGYFPICVKCVKRLKREAECRYDGYLEFAPPANYKVK
ncbi:hypothetical protein MYO4S_00239 [Serratia phage 4S]|nr:hypothetical protein MYO4S_00239 [Serratia phage 4S]